MILNSFPQVRVNSPLVVAVVLGIILTIGILKEGLTDYSRHQQDKRTNNTPTIKIGGVSNDQDEFVSTRLADIKVGDVLFLKDKSQIPADCVVLRTKNDTGSAEGFIQTAQLDGERNLKPKLPIKRVADIIDDYKKGLYEI